MLRKMNKGFTMIELLVVLVIIAILAAVATPMYLANTKRSRATEAVSTMALLRQAEREFKINRNTYIAVASDNIQDQLPGATLTPATDGLDVNAGEVTQYFSNHAYTVVTSAPKWNSNIPTSLTQNIDPVDFVIQADGKLSTVCGTTNCATKASEVKGTVNGNTTDGSYILQMDNSGRTFVSYDSGKTGTWSLY